MIHRDIIIDETLWKKVDEIKSRPNRQKQIDKIPSKGIIFNSDDWTIKMVVSESKHRHKVYAMNKHIDKLETFYWNSYRKSGVNRINNIGYAGGY